MEQFRQEVDDIDTRANDEMIERKMRQIEERKRRKEEKRKNEEQRKKNEASAAVKGGKPADSAEKATPQPSLKVGSTVRIKGLTSVGTIEKIDGKQATVIFGGGMRTKMRLDRLEEAKEPAAGQSKSEERNQQIVGTWGNLSNSTRSAIDSRRLNFRQDLDVRGMRGDEAIQAVTYFIDDAILVGMSRVRILHGTGTGILRQLIRQYLATVPNVSHFRDEHVQFGGAGITVVDID